MVVIIEKITNSLRKDGFIATWQKIKRSIIRQFGLDNRLTDVEENVLILTARLNYLEKCIADTHDRFITPRERLAVYTVLIGDYDVLLPPVWVDSFCDYYCITNNKELKSDFWKIIYLDDAECDVDPTRLNRKIKLSPHVFFPQYEHSLYIDTSIVILNSVWDWIDKFSAGLPMLLFKHQDRTVIYEEAEVCKKLKKDDPGVIDAQMSKYRADGYADSLPLTWNAIIYRKHNDERVIEIDEQWLKEVLNESCRDQLSFCYVCWKAGFKYSICEASYTDYFLWDSQHSGKYARVTGTRKQVE